MTRLNDFLLIIENTVSSFFCVVMSLIVIAEVACRYILGTTTMVGVQEIATWCYIWMTTMACAALYCKKMHIATEYFFNTFCPHKLQDIVHLFTTVLLVLFLLAVIITGFPFAIGQWQMRATSADIPKTVFFVSLPIAFSFMLIHSIMHIREILARISSAKRSKEV